MDKLQEHHHDMYLFCEQGGGIPREPGQGGGGEGDLVTGGGYCLPPHVTGAGGMPGGGGGGDGGGGGGGGGGYPLQSSIMSSAPSPSPGACAPLYHYSLQSDPMGVAPGVGGGGGGEGGGGGVGMRKTMADFPWVKEKKMGSGRPKDPSSQMTLSTAGEISRVCVSVYLHCSQLFIC